METQVRQGIRAGARRQAGAGAGAPLYRRARRAPGRRRGGLARALGWFSLALGLVEIVAPHRLARLIGVRRRHRLLRALGLREIASGIGLLTRRRPVGWLWTRIAGDAMDLALLGAALRPRPVRRERVGAALAAVAGVALLDILSARRLSQSARRERAAKERPLQASMSIRINRSPEEAYQFWRNFQNLPRFMRHLESVEVLGEKQSRWKLKLPGGAKAVWDVEIVDDQPNKAIVWRARTGEEVVGSGVVRFESGPAGRGTVVSTEPKLYLPGTVRARRLLSWQVQEDLRRFKQLLETGVLATTEGQPSGRRGLIFRYLKKERRHESNLLVR